MIYSAVCDLSSREGNQSVLTVCLLVSFVVFLGVDAVVNAVALRSVLSKPNA